MPNLGFLGGTEIRSSDGKEALALRRWHGCRETSAFENRWACAIVVGFLAPEGSQAIDGRITSVEGSV